MMAMYVGKKNLTKLFFWREGGAGRQGHYVFEKARVKSLRGN